jgi:serine/threonine protein kinase
VPVTSSGMPRTMSFRVDLLSSLRVWRTEDGSRMINEYRVMREIGKGTYGVVYLCVKNLEASAATLSEHRTQTYYAVKVVKKSALRKRKSLRRPGAGVGDRSLDLQIDEQDPADVERMEHELAEVAIMKRLRHNNIVQLYEVIDDPAGTLMPSPYFFFFFFSLTHSLTHTLSLLSTIYFV